MRPTFIDDDSLPVTSRDKLTRLQSVIQGRACVQLYSTEKLPVEVKMRRTYGFGPDHQDLTSGYIIAACLVV